MILRQAYERDEPKYQRSEHDPGNPIYNARATRGPRPRKWMAAPVVRWDPHSIGRIHGLIPRLMLNSPQPRVRPVRPHDAACKTGTPVTNHGTQFNGNAPNVEKRKQRI
jgi:hypothetical protein